MFIARKSKLVHVPTFSITASFFRFFIDFHNLLAVFIVEQMKKQFDVLNSYWRKIHSCRNSPLHILYMLFCSFYICNLRCLFIIIIINSDWNCNKTSLKGYFFCRMQTKNRRKKLCLLYRHPFRIRINRSG